MYSYGAILSILDQAGIYYKRIGKQYMGVCPVCGRGHRTPCCSYSEENLWYCFSCGSGGGIKALKEALKLNVDLKKFTVSGVQIKKEIKKEVDLTCSVKLYLSEKPDVESIRWLENRRIDYEKVKDFIKFITPKKSWHYKNGFRIAIPSIDKKGRMRNVKIRNVFDEEKRKNLEIGMKVISWKGGENYIIGLNFIPDDADFVLIVEGEMDFLSVKSLDKYFPVIAVPSANYKFKDELQYLPKKIFLLLDNDEVGKRHSERLKNELEEKNFKVRIESYPKGIKDFNDLLMLDKKKAFEKLLKVKKGA